MLNGRMPAVVIVAVLAALAALVLVTQPYTEEFPGHGFARPAQRFLTAALRQDSTALARLSVAPQPVAWALAAARREPGRLAAWGHGAQAWLGARSADTTEVFVLNASSEVCQGSPIRVRFVGTDGQAKVVEAQSACFQGNAGGQVR